MSKILSKDEVIEIIIKETEYTRDDILKMINETIETMDNMVNEEGAAFVVANNLGVSINPRKIAEALKINQLVPGQSNISVIARVNRIYTIREFTRKDNTKGKVRNLEIIDGTGKAKISLWDMKTSIIEDRGIKVGNIIRINGGNTKMGYQDSIEITIGSRGSLDLEAEANEANFPSVEKAPMCKLIDITPEMRSVSVHGKIVDRQGINKFEHEGKEGQVTNLTIDDGTKKARIVFWNETVDTALTFDKGDAVIIYDLRVGENKFNDIELTFNSFSKIERSEQQFDNIGIIEDKIIQTLSEIEPGMRGLTVTGILVSKSDIRTFDRNGDEGKVASITIRDNQQSVKVNLWGDTTKYLETMEEGSLIRIHKTSSILSDFSGEVELSCNDRSRIEVSNDEVDVDMFKSEDVVIEFSDINIARSGVNIELMVTSVFDPREITKNDGTTSNVQNISVIDKEGTYGRVAAWDDNIDKIANLAEGQAFLAQNVKVKPSSGTYGPEVVMQSNSNVQILDNSDEFQFSKTNRDSSYESIELNNTEKLNTSGSKVTFSGIITSVSSFVIYDGCSECPRKAYRNSDIDESGECSVHGEVTITPKMVLTVSITNDSGSALITLFNDQVEKLFGFSSQEAKSMVERLGEQEAPVQKAEVLNRKITINGVVTYNENREEYSINVNYFS